MGNVIHLDANYLIGALVPGSVEEANLTSWLSGGELLAMSAVAWGEFPCGPLTLEAESAARLTVTNFVELRPADAEVAARLFNLSGRRSRSFSDCLIAAVAIRSRARLATSNTSDFAPLVPHGLVLV